MTSVLVMGSNAGHPFSASAPRILAHAEGLVAAVPSSDGLRTYRVAVVGDHVVCTCAAGVHGRACKHVGVLLEELKRRARAQQEAVPA